MSSSNPIVLDSSSEDEEQERNTGSQTRSNEPIINDEKLRTYMEVTGMPRDAAISQLLKFQQNLDLCIQSHFDHVNYGENVENIAMTDNAINESDYNEPNSAATQANPSSQKVFESQTVRLKDDRHHNMLYQPSKAWEDVAKRCREIGVKFVDHDFPPNSTSLDGRRQQHPSSAPLNTMSKKDIDNSQARIIKCRCGVPACVRSVQRDGPNYGRFFLACGKPKPSRRKRAVKRKRKDSSDKNEDDIIIIDDENDDKKQTELQSERQCQFFQWDDNHTQSNHLTKDRLLSRLSWFRFETEHGHSLIGKSPNEYYSPNHVRQGAMGNCWFLSALAVVAEKSYLIQRLLPHDKFNDIGCYEVCFCLDGRWKGILVDSSLPAIARKARSTGEKQIASNSKTQKQSKRGSFQIKEDIVIQPAFAAGNVSWPAIIEKAYAKVHGSYSRLSGGFVSEAFYDLTGAPVERILFRNIYDYDELFARLLSFSNAGFLMGVCTSAGGDGLVPCHAYSLLGVYEIHDAVVGEQKKVTNFFQKGDDDKDVIFVEDTKENRPLGSTIRLARIRNPWGVREWKGKWSAESVEWTSKIKSAIGKNAYKQGDGTFFMSYEDMVQRFDHMDVAKCQKGWKRNSKGGAIKLHKTRDALFSCSLAYLCEVKERTWAFVSLVQRKKRANATTQFWYTDLSMIVLKRKGTGEWERHQCCLQGVKRACDHEIFMDPQYQYCFIPFSYLSGKKEVEFGAEVIQSQKSAPFNFTTYSAKEVNVRAQVRSSVGQQKPLQTLHSSLLEMKKRNIHITGPKSVLITSKGDGCIYFLALNAGAAGLALNLTLVQHRGMVIVHGGKSNSNNIPPKTQCIILVLANEGRDISPSIDFTFKTDSLDGLQSNVRNDSPYGGIGTKIPLSLAAELLCSDHDADSGYKCSKGTII